MAWLYWQIRREIAHRRRIGSAMREMRRNGYRAEYHDILPENRRRAARWN